MTIQASTARPESTASKLDVALRLVALVGVLFIFFVSIKVMGSSMKAFTGGYAGDFLTRTAANPLIGLLMGMLVTSLVQSSSTVTSLLVGFVAGGVFPLRVAIPMVMGANIGTTITNTIVSLGHIKRKDEFERAFAVSTVHDFFNVCAVIVIFPLEISTHFLERGALFLTDTLFGTEVGEFRGLQAVLKPGAHWIMEVSPNDWVSLFIGLVGLFTSLTLFVKLMRSMLLRKLTLAIDRFIFGRAFVSFVAGIMVTALVQSSSVTTSLIVPLAGAGILTIHQIFPYTLGANIGTTITALLAAMAFATTGSSSTSGTGTLGLTLAIVHLLFNISGMLLLYPLRFIPITMSQMFARFATKSNKALAACVIVYFLIYLVPIMFVVLK